MAAVAKPTPGPRPHAPVRPKQSGYAGDDDGADPGRRVWPAATAVAVLGLVIGLLAGLVYSAFEPKTYQATTSVSVLPDPNLNFSTTNDNTTTIDQDATAFIQSQLVVVNGAQLAERVRNELGLPSTPGIEATQLGQTYVVSIATSADTQAKAIRVADRVATDYDSIRTGQLTSEINSLLADTNSQISSVSRSLNASRAGSRSSSQLTPSQTALQTEYERLLSQRSALNGVKAQSGRIVTVVVPARSSTAGLSTAVKNGLVGALLGLLVGLGIFIVLRRSVRRVRTVGDVAALGLAPLLPVQSSRSWRSGRAAGATRPDPNARLLAARLDPDLSAGNPIAFVGVTDEVGADRISLAVASALTDRSPVLYLPRVGSVPARLAGDGTREPDAAEFAELLEPGEVAGVWTFAIGRSGAPADNELRPTRQLRTAQLASVFRQARRHGYLVIVEADPVAESDRAIDCGLAGAAMVLVVARDVTSPSDVVVATELFAAQSVTLLGAVMSQTPPRPVRLLRARRSTAAGPASAEVGSAEVGSAEVKTTVPESKYTDGRLEGVAATSDEPQIADSTIADETAHPSAEVETPGAGEVSGDDARLTDETSEDRAAADDSPVAEPPSDETSTEAASDEPTSDDPTSDEPTSDDPTSDDPVTDESVSGEPASDGSATAETTKDGSGGDGARGYGRSSLKRRRSRRRVGDSTSRPR